MIIFNKKLKLRIGGLENSFDKTRSELEEEIDSLRKTVSQITEQWNEIRNMDNEVIRKLKCIIKYSKDNEVTYYLDRIEVDKYPDSFFIGFEFKHILYIYSNKEEYEFKIEEFHGNNIYVQQGNIRYDKSGIVYLSLKSKNTDIIYDLMLDLNSNKYICAVAKS